jgi:hypothetical protein
VFDFFLPSLTLENINLEAAPLSSANTKKSKKSSPTHEPEELLDIALTENPTNVLLKRLSPH